MSTILAFPLSSGRTTLSNDQLLRALGAALARLPTPINESAVSREQLCVLTEGIRLLGGVDRTKLPLLSAALAHVSLAVEAGPQGEMGLQSGTGSQIEREALKRHCA